MPGRIILTMDGGGIRCIIQLQVLRELERRMIRAGKGNRLHRNIDLIAGAGFGGMIGAALAFPKPDNPAQTVSTPEEMLFLFQYFHQFVFGPQVPEGAGFGPVDATDFEENLRKRFGAQTLMSAALTGILIPAFDVLNHRPVTFTNLDPASANFYVWQAVRSGSSLPEYFAPSMVENLARSRPRGTPLTPMINGGAMWADPALPAYSEASRLGWTGSGEEFTIVSIGSGVDSSPITLFGEGVSGIHGAGLAETSPQLVEMALKLKCPIAYQMDAIINRGASPFNGISTRVTEANRKALHYFRIDGALEKATADVSDIREHNIRAVLADGERIIAENSLALDEIVDRMEARPEMDDGARPAPRDERDRDLGESVHFA